MLKFNQNIKPKQVKYNAIFYSAFKALVVLDLLMQSPKTLAQIKEELQKIPYIKSDIADDTLRVYLNTFKIAGCDVERVAVKSKKRQYTYYISNNPFKPQITEIQAKKLFDIYDVLIYNLPFEQVLQVELLMRKFVKYFNVGFFEALYKEHSLLQSFDPELLNNLEKCCQDNALVTVLYQSPRSGLKEIPIIAYKMKIQNYKLYLEGFGMEYKQEAIFLVDRIKQITDVIAGDQVELPKESFLSIIFELYDSDVELTECEELLETTNDYRVVKHTTSNKVLTFQRFLELGPLCKIIGPLEFKLEFIAKLNSVKEVYINEK